MTPAVDTEAVRVKIVGDLFHGRLPEPTQPGRPVIYIFSGELHQVGEIGAGGLVEA